MRKILIFIALLFIAVIAVAGLYFSKLSLKTRNSDKILSYIPQDAALVVEFRNDRSFQEIFKDYHLFNDIVGGKDSAGLAALQSLLISPQFSNGTDGFNTFLSFHHNTVNSQIDLLWLASLEKTQNNDIHEALLKSGLGYRAQKISLAGKDAIQLNIDSIAQPFYLILENGIGIGSFSKPLLQKCLDSKTAKISKDFIAEITSGSQINENSLVNLFVKHGNIDTFFTGFLNGKLGGNSALLAQLTGYSTLNMNFKSDALMFNGIAAIDTGTANYINLFRNQKPVKTSIVKAFPASTANYVALGISDYRLFDVGLQKLLNKRNELKKLKNQFALLKAQTGVDVDQDLKKFFNDEFAVFQLADHQKLAIIKLTNGADMAKVLESISQPQTEEIMELNNSNIFYYCFGDPMLNFPRPYFIIADNYMILANTASALHQFMEDYASDNLLYKTVPFANFNQFVANQSTISYFMNIENSKNILKSSLKKPFANNLKNLSFGLNKFYGLSYQWSADRGHFFTNMYASLRDTSTTQTKPE